MLLQDSHTSVAIVQQAPVHRWQHRFGRVPRPHWNAGNGRGSGKVSGPAHLGGWACGPGQTIKGAGEFIFVTQDARAGNGPGVCVWATAALRVAGASAAGIGRTGQARIDVPARPQV